MWRALINKINLFVILSLCLFPYITACDENSGIVEHGLSSNEPIISKRAGLGDTFSFIESAWDYKDRRELPFSVKLEIGNGCELIYGIGCEGYSFGDPERAGRLEANSESCFGAEHNENPTATQFFQGIKDLMPSDSVLVKAFVKKEGTFKKEIYCFQSKRLSSAPGIKESCAYHQSPEAIGNFSLYLNYELGNDNNVANYLLALGSPAEVGLHETKPFSPKHFSGTIKQVIPTDTANHTFEPQH